MVREGVPGQQGLSGTPVPGTRPLVGAEARAPPSAPCCSHSGPSGWTGGPRSLAPPVLAQAPLVPPGLPNAVYSAWDTGATTFVLSQGAGQAPPCRAVALTTRRLPPCAPCGHLAAWGSWL